MHILFDDTEMQQVALLQDHHIKPELWLLQIQNCPKEQICLCLIELSSLSGYILFSNSVLLG